MFRVVGQSVKQLGIFPRLSDVLSASAMTATIEDAATANRQIIANFVGVRCAGHTWDISARGLVAENVPFVCIRVFDESGD